MAPIPIRSSHRCLLPDPAATAKLLAVTAPERVPPLQEMSERRRSGFLDLVILDFVGWIVRSERRNATPARAASNRVLARPSVRVALAKAAEPADGSGDEFGACIKLQISLFGPVVKDAGNKLPR